MATPYVVPKVPLNCCHPGYHCKSKTGLCQERSNRNECRFTYAHRCSVCDAHTGHNCCRRRSKSEGVDGDPLRELNRDYEVECQRRWVPKEREVVNVCGDSRRGYVIPASRSVLNEYPVEYGESYPRSMDVDRGVDHAKSFSERSTCAQRKFRDRTLTPNHRYQPKCQQDPYVSISHARPLRERETSRYASIPQNNECFSVCPTKPEASNSNFRNIVPLEARDVDGSRRKCDGHDVPLKHNGHRIHADGETHQRKASQYRQYRQCGQCDGRQSEEARASPAAMQNHYLREMAALRTKLHEIRDGAEGKRLRQRSESEPGVTMVGAVSQEASREPKRARDISPGLWDAGYRQVQDSWHRADDRELPKRCIPDVKLPIIQRQHKKSVSTARNNRNSLRDDVSVSSDSDFADSDRTGGSGEDGDSKGEPAEDSEEDDQSVMSSFTTVSTDSNTPSVVGETLGSISLNDSTRVEKGVGFDGYGRKTHLPGFLRASLFSHVPPYVQFSTHEEKGESLPSEIQRLMKWKLSTITPLIVRRTLVNSGFRLIRSEFYNSGLFHKESNDWIGTWGKHMKSFCFKTLKDSQKMNHFPGTFQIGRKDRLWKNLHRLMAKFGKKEFGFIPHTYILPQDTKVLRQAWERSCGKSRWIIKPPASARGTGIKVVHRWAQIPKKKPLVVQKYIAQPYLINGSKFDLRLYVLVTSINPLRIYMYDDGLVRFASVKYSADMASLGDRYMHLTNYSINKLSSHYTQNEDASACHGHKWTVKTLWAYLAKGGVDVKMLWHSLVDLVIKTIISGESSIGQMTKANLVSRYCSYELFGIDVLLDHELKPWLLEVNISPSLHSSSPLDLAVKGPLVRDLMNIAGFQIPKLTPAQQEEFGEKWGTRDPLCFDRRLYTMLLSQHERMKHLRQQQHSRDEYLEDILKNLTPDDIRHLIQSEDELTQAGNFIRIFPTSETYTYHEFFEGPRYYNMMFDAWETKYHNNRQEGIELLECLCRKKQHLVVPVSTAAVKSSASPQSQPVNENTYPLPLSIGEEAAVPSTERKPVALSSVTLYRAVRPRSGARGVVLRPFSRIVHLGRRPRGPYSRGVPSDSSSGDDEEGEGDCEDSSTCVKC
ncbi:tubulin monoglutamylase TTLL4-like isoform X3 [Bacillus rossius redtenbacheri]|uniref:tubulin monoglutamylase TTLL4-like isoform X3 n=1 Tax=Bacillus rossius redtenbacheri TaxID=93214 RepID=UPI002FDD1D32